MHPMSKEMVAGTVGEGERKYQITLTISHATQSLQGTQRAVLTMPHINGSLQSPVSRVFLHISISQCFARSPGTHFHFTFR
jgi:hypothetical protein